MEATLSAQEQPKYWLADHNDVWFRHVLENGAMLAKAPRWKVKNLSNNLEVVHDRPWKAEISGRLLSKATDVKEKAEALAASSQSSSIKFRHVIFLRVEEVRNIPGVDVYAEPNSDLAHANFVCFILPMAQSMDELAAPKISVEFLQNICNKAGVCDADDISVLEDLRLVPRDPTL